MDMKIFMLMSLFTLRLFRLLHMRCDITVSLTGQEESSSDTVVTLVVSCAVVLSIGVAVVIVTWRVVTHNSKDYCVNGQYRNNQLEDKNKNNKNYKPNCSLVTVNTSYRYCSTNSTNHNLATLDFPSEIAH